METNLVYFDETGDDGVTTASSEFFVLTSLYMSASKWQENYEKIRKCRRELKNNYGFHISEEFHTKHLLTDKGLYRDHGWSTDQRREIIVAMAKCIADLNIKVINVIIDKTRFVDQNYHVLENALKYNIQRIENDSHGEWNYIIITDKGRVAPMRSTAKAIRAYNPIPSQFSPGYINQPINNLIEDILEKDSEESYFIQACDFISYFVHLYYKTHYKEKPLPNRVGRVVDPVFVSRVLATLKAGNVLNLKANSTNDFGLVIYPK
nr:DUF3800 domain-containing protein [Clostridia bacterium]